MNQISPSITDATTPSAPMQVRETGTAKGRGVFAAGSFREGEVVEVSPVIVLPGRFRDLTGVLKRYVFNWGSLAKTTRSSAVALGFGSLYNHANPANLCYRARPSEQALIFTAARDIAAGEELTINYNASGGGASWHNDNWFDRTGVDVIDSTETCD